jgi:hypothetical protein
MKPPVPLLPDERVIFSSTRRGDAGHSTWWWLLAIFVGLQVCGGLLFVGMALGISGQSSQGGVSTVVTLLLAAAGFARWLQLRLQPSYFITSQRVIARRFFSSPLVFAPQDVGAAARFVIKHMRNGSLLHTQITHSMVVALRTGGTHRFGPVHDAEGMLVLFEGIAQGVIDVRVLPGENGELSRAETRRDIFFARTSRTADAERGPLFVGPTTVIGFAAELMASRMLQLYTILGAERDADDIEASMVALAHNSAFGRAVVMNREGATLALNGQQLLLSSEASKVGFDLSPADALRAKTQLPREEHPYR